jgi:hypothetical protein
MVLRDSVLDQCSSTFLPLSYNGFEFRYCVIGMVFPGKPNIGGLPPKDTIHKKLA